MLTHSFPINFYFFFTYSVFTENQKKALDYQRHLCVTANAGAGKTTVLVQRFVDILLNTGARVDQLVAITFTDKAASELKKKITEQIQKRMFSETVPANVMRLEQIRDQLATANIGTIHSFCAGLLREFPVEADVDAGFTVLEGVDQEMLVQEAIRQSLEFILSEKQGKQLRLDLLDVIRMLGQRTIQNYLTVFLHKREQIERLLRNRGEELLNASAKEVLSGWKSGIENDLIKRLDDSSWLDALKRLCLIAKGKQAKEVEGLCHQWNARLSHQKKFKLFEEITAIALTKEGGLRKTFIGKDAELGNNIEDEALIKDFYSSIIELIQAYNSPDTVEADTTLLRLVRTLIYSYRQALEMYEDKKFENGQLDFEDLQLKTNQLLTQEEVRAKIAEKFAFIMVDEYQDTNRLQYEIVHSLVSNFQTGNLFIVGDPKQSIYGFRNAEVEIFEATRADIHQSNPHDVLFKLNGSELTSTEDERKGLLTLPESFRPLKSIVAFVNNVFSSSHHPEGNVRFDELVKGRNNDADGNIELMLVRSEEGSDAGNPIKQECRMIARRISELKRSEYNVFEKRDEASRSFRFGDTAILLRSRTHLRELERALVEEHIPYLLSGGIGFYQTQEVFDFLNYFKFLLNPEDDVALLGILRSPFFAISDAELFEVSLINKNDTLWSRCRQYTDKGKPSDLLKRSLRILSSDLDYAKRLSIPFLLQRILRNTGWEGTVAGLQTGGQSSANVQKLLHIAREFTGRGLTRLYDFVERLNTLINEEQREGQAAMETTDNCVQVMTIHAAKGMEFPVVVIPFADKKLKQDSSPYIDPAIGISFTVRSEKDYDKEEEPLLHRYLRLKSREKTESEERRIFYVAATRARDMLVISGNADSGINYSSYLRLVFNSLGLEADSLKEGVISFHSDIKVLNQTGQKSEITVLEYTAGLKISFSKNEKPDILEHQQRSKNDMNVTSLFTQPLKGNIQGEFFSSTQMRTFLECPTKYLLRYVLGVPEQSFISFPFNEHEDPNDRITGEVEGSLTHSVLQDFHKDQNEEVIRQKIREITGTVLLEGNTRLDSVVESITSNVLNFQKSSFGQSVLSSKEAKTEYTISSVFGTDYLTGTIDMLYKDEKELWSILDYKTDSITKKDIMLRAGEYKYQMLFYALLVYKQFMQKNVRISIVFLRYADQPVHFDFSEADILDFEMKIRDSIRKIKNGEFDRNEEQCAKCTYQFDGKCLFPKT